MRIKRADLSVENEKAVYDRMIAERERQAKQFRSEGEEEALKIRAETDKDKAIILANAFKSSRSATQSGSGLIFGGCFSYGARSMSGPVSYTHLTLPTKRIV